MNPVTKTANLIVSSNAFTTKENIPAKYTCEGENINPPLTIENIPEGTKSLAIIVEDPDAPHGTFDHWIIWNIKPVKTIAENSAPGIEGKNSYGNTRYNGPCPPSGVHRYFFKVFALDILLDAPENSDKKTIEKAMQNHILAQGEIISKYKKSA